MFTSLLRSTRVQLRSHAITRLGSSDFARVLLNNNCSLTALMVTDPAPALAASEGDRTGWLCSAFVDALPVTGASISVFGRDGRQSTICATDSVASRGETLQFELGEGPHWEALQTGLHVLVQDLSASAESSRRRPGVARDLDGGAKRAPASRCASDDNAVAESFDNSSPKAG
jgi:hypothetical protein